MGTHVKLIGIHFFRLRMHLREGLGIEKKEEKVGAELCQAQNKLG